MTAFLERKRRDFSRYTTKSLRWLQDRVETLDVRPPIWKRLRKEQRVGFIAGVEKRKFCYWYDMGMGKTLLAIALTRYFKRAKTVKRVLVLIPNKINKYEWANEIKKHSPGSTYTVLAGSSRRKWEQIQESESTFVLETYGGLVRLLCQMVKVKKKNKLVPDRRLVKTFLKFIQGIVLDESIMIVRKKRHGSLMHRLCRKIAKESAVAFALNGTPFGRDPTDMWGQFHVIDEGETLGETLGLFRAAFFKASEGDYALKYEFDPKKEKLLNQIITNRSIRYEADESTLPSLSMIPKEIPLPLGADEYYEKAKQQVIASAGNFREQKNAFLRMRQISSGFIGYNDDETGDKARFAFDTNPKLELVISMAEQLTDQHKLVVFHEFTYSGDAICAELKKAKIAFARLYGKTKDPEAALARFHDDKRCRVFVLQNASGGFGLDRLKVARYGICYESPVGTVLRRQIIRRIQRQGSEHGKVFWYDLVVRGTVDAQILDAHQQGIDLFKAIVDRRIKLK